MQLNLDYLLRQAQFSACGRPLPKRHRELGGSSMVLSIVRVPRGVLYVAFVVLTAACGGATDAGYSGGPPPPPPPPQAPNSVTVSNNLFTPAATAVSPGTTVTWTWDACTAGTYGNPATCVSHNVTFEDGLTPSSPTQNSGNYTHAFAAGIYNYHCTIHGTATSGMRGTITVR
ncbi:MAG: hypothetical protein NVS9B3_15040 [Gemmatimonadaceae bacterium]